MRKPTLAPKKRSNKPAAKARRVARKSKRQLGFKSDLQKIAGEVVNSFSGRPRDIVSAIKMDHDALRKFIKILKDTERPMSERRQAYRSFASLLKSHSVAEEEIIYAAASEFTGRELKIKVAEGFVEHQVCDALIAKIERTKDPLSWSAHANVLSEILEHHLKEEERDLLPLIRKQVSAEADQDLIDLYVQKRSQTQRIKTAKNEGVLNART